MLSPNPPLLSGSDYGVVGAIEQAKIDADPLFERSHGISDERRYYYSATGFLKALGARERGSPWPDHAWATDGRNDRAAGRTRIRIDATIGFRGFYVGPEPYVIDPPALTNPLLARLPAGDGWRIGHFSRVIPNGYVETILTGSNEICDEKLARYYDKLSLVTRGSLLDWSRLMAIWKLNTGQYDDWIDRALYRRVPLYQNEKGLTQYSVEELDAHIRKDPSDAYAHYKLGIAYANLGNIDQALAHWEVAVRAHPNDRCMRRDLALAYELKKPPSENAPTQ
jgi:tetratricopeptide (TPR) repeat protein